MCRLPSTVSPYERIGSIMKISQMLANRRGGARGQAGMLLAFCLFGAGCAAITNPVSDGIPVRELPDEYRGKSREGLRPIPLTMLRQKPILVHEVGPGDVLGIVIENVLG